MNNSSPQSTANKKQDEKRKSDPRLPSSRLSENESYIMDKLYKGFSSKKEGILNAAKSYLEANKPK